MLFLDSSDLLVLDEGDRFLAGELDNDGAAGGVGTLGLYWRSPIGGTRPDRVTCPIEEMEPPELKTEVSVTTVAVRVTASAAGASEMTLTDLDTEIAVPFDGGAAEMPVTGNRRVYRLRAAALNSRGSAVAADLTVYAAAGETKFCVTKDLFPLAVFAPDEMLVFGARIADTAGRPLDRAEIERCSVTVYRQVRNSRGVGRVPAPTPFGAETEVPLTAFLDRPDPAAPWRRDRLGGNFRYAAPVPLAEFCGGRGVYDAVFRVTPRAGNPFRFAYSILAGGKGDAEELNIPRPRRSTADQCGGGQGIP